MEFWQNAGRQAHLCAELYTLCGKMPAQGAMVAGQRLVDFVSEEGGLCAAVFEDEVGHISVVFRGTGKNEWLDNGQALSGEPIQNVYYRYDPPGVYYEACDYNSPAQAAALNWFRKMAHRQGWSEGTHITLSGHSKGGNKAQFVAMHTDLADICYSFDGQGFSPEALRCFAKQPAFEQRRGRIYSLSADNDYVNVLGRRVMPPENIFYLKSSVGADNMVLYHQPEAILDAEGELMPLTRQGHLSRSVAALSDELMGLPPHRRKYITEGIMLLFQKGNIADIWGLLK